MGHWQLALRRRAYFGWDVARFFIRIFIEYVVTVWLLGIAPFVAHMIAETEQANAYYGWIPNDLYLFVMVTGGGAAMEAFQDQESDGPLRLIAGVTGILGLLVGAWAYGSLEVGTASINSILKAATPWVIASVLGIYLWYRVPFMVGDAWQEAVRKRGDRNWRIK